MQIKLTTTKREVANDVLLPLQNKNTVFAGEPLEENAGVEWGEVEVERGAFETVFEILGILQIGSMAVGVVSGVIANWLWSRIHSSDKTPSDDSGEIKIEIKVDNGVDSQTFQIEYSSIEAMTVSITSAIESQNKITVKTQK